MLSTNYIYLFSLKHFKNLPVNNVFIAKLILRYTKFIDKIYTLKLSTYDLYGNT